MREFTKSMLSYTWAMTTFGMQQTLNLFSAPRRGEQHPATGAFNNAARATSEQMGDAMRATYRAGDNIQRGLVDLTFSVLTLGVFNQRGGGGDRGGGGRDARDWTRAASDIGRQTGEAVRQGANVVGQAAQSFGAATSAARRNWGGRDPRDWGDGRDARDWTNAASDVGRQTGEAIRQGANAVGQAAQAVGAATSAAAQQTGWGPMPRQDEPDVRGGGRGGGGKRG